MYEKTEDNLPDVDAHACPHIMQNIRFHAPLNSDGKRIATKAIFRVSYMAAVNRSPSPTIGSREKPNKREAAPVRKITAQTLGLTTEAKAAQGIKALLRIAIEPNGEAKYCTLVEASFVDALDAQLCKKAKALPYISALDHEGKAKYDEIYVELRF